MNGELAGSLPIAASEVAQSWDTLYIFLFAICVFFFVIVVAGMIIFSIKYRQRPGHQASDISHNTQLEIVWTVIPTILVMVIFVWGWLVYRQMAVDVPTNAMEIKVVAQQWFWTFQYEDGRTLRDQVFVPKGKPVRFLITSRQNDVLHAFFIPNFRVKKDAVPGMYTSVWITPTMVGQHQIFCAEYCGTSHSDMLAKLVVLDEEQWKIWKWGGKIDLPGAVGVGGVQVAREPSIAANVLVQTTQDLTKEPPIMEGSLIDEGKRLTQVKGCVACHSDDGSKRIGPSYKGVFGHEVELADGKKVMVDENYIRESILQPQAKIVKGFENLIMPPYAGQFDEKELNAVIDYIKSVR